MSPLVTQFTRVRWMLRGDLPDVLRIEKGSFEFTWGEEEFLTALVKQNCIGMVAEFDEQVVGYMIYELHRQHIKLLNLAVSPRHRRSAIGTALIHKLIGKLSDQRRREIMLEVRETNLKAQLFFRSLGFLATNVLRSRYDETDEDTYVFVYHLIDGTDTDRPISANTINA